MIFRQLLDPATSSYSYLLADSATLEAVLIDSVREQVDRDLQLLSELGLTLLYALETHVHADHVTGAGLLRERLGCRLGVGKAAGVLTADVQLEDGDRLEFGRCVLEARETPGHTHGCVTYVVTPEVGREPGREKAMAFTGDALLIRGCGRTDFQQGNARTLHASVREKIFSLPSDTRLYPGHDYRGHSVTTVAEERRFNPRLGDSKTLEEFLEIMDGLRLAHPKRIDEAIPANMASGVTEPEKSRPSAQEGDRWAPLERTTSNVPVIAAAWVEAHSDDVRIVDVREHVEFCGPLGHIESAELVPLAALLDATREWDRQQPIVTACAYGTRSGKAATMLAEAGFARVASLHGGMIRWLDEGHRAVEVMGDRVRQDAATWRGMDI